jgi:hypothetical protein
VIGWIYARKENPYGKVKQCRKPKKNPWNNQIRVAVAVGSDNRKGRPNRTPDQHQKRTIYRKHKSVIF